MVGAQNFSNEYIACNTSLSDSCDEKGTYLFLVLKSLIVQFTLKNQLTQNFTFLTVSSSGLKITLSFASNGTDSNALDLPVSKNGKWLNFCSLKMIKKKQMVKK